MTASFVVLLFGVIIFAHSLKPYTKRFGAARWQAAIEAATRDMIGQLRAEMPAGRLG